MTALGNGLLHLPSDVSIDGNTGEVYGTVNVEGYLECIGAEGVYMPRPMHLDAGEFELRLVVHPEAHDQLQTTGRCDAYLRFRFTAIDGTVTIREVHVTFWATEELGA
ncbi:MAG TPA: hypothetical protein VF250_08105 [Conexibacter sp.]